MTVVTDHAKFKEVDAKARLPGRPMVVTRTHCSPGQTAFRPVVVVQPVIGRVVFHVHSVREAVRAGQPSLFVLAGLIFQVVVPVLVFGLERGQDVDGRGIPWA